MSYVRKTYDVWVVQGFYTPYYGWEDVYEAQTKQEGRECLRSYLQNDTAPYRLVKRRVRKETA
jgi:hypothetical protein